MKFRIAVAAALVATSLRTASIPCLAGPPAVGVVDSIEMSRVVALVEHFASDRARRAILPSPGATHFALLLRRGNLSNNTNEFTLQIWSTSQASTKRAPDQSITLASSSNRPGIQDVKWLPQGETLFFLGERQGELHQLYSFNIKSGELTQLSHSSTNVLSYGASTDGRAIVLAAEEPAREIWDRAAMRQGLLVSPELPVQDLIVGKRDPGDPRFCDYVQIILLRRDRDALSERRIADHVKMWPGDPLSLSPDLMNVLLPVMVELIPESWADYQDPLIQRLARNRVRAGQYSVLRRYAVLDVATGKLDSLIDAPIDVRYPASFAWNPSGRSAVVTNTYLPIAAVSKSRGVADTGSSFTVEVDLATRQVKKLSSDKLLAPAWNDEDTLTFDTAVPGEGERPQATFRRRADNWEKARTVTQAAIVNKASRKFSVVEDLNTPPRLIVRDGRPDRSRTLFDPNPRFSRLAFGRVRKLHWRTVDGFEESGGLYFPVGYESGRRYPLVIQTHGFDSAQFWIDGPYTTGFCAQALAGRGIMVLQAEEDSREFDTHSGTLYNVQMFEAAIEDLNGRGLIDPERIGIIGFSHTAPDVAYALIRSKYHFTAAAFADAVDNGYLLYLFDNTPDYQRSIEGSLGGPPFAPDSLETWLRRSPTFNMNEIATPIRIVAASPVDLLYEWDWLQGLARLGKPVEMVVLQDGAHELQKPWERIVSQEGNVDWFSFWLAGYEEPIPAKRDQYLRWEKMCEVQKSAHPDRPAFCATVRQ